MQSKTIRHILYLSFLWLSVSFGCTGPFFSSQSHSKTVEDEHFVIITASAGDTLSSLANTYLNDENKAWQIAAYNQIDTLVTGQQVVVPLVELNRGGLQRQGYQTVPVLLYPEVADKPIQPRVVSTNTFDHHMQFLTENGFVSISLDQLHAFLNLEDQIPPNAVVITFDTADGWVYDIAFPILRRQGLKAALFVPIKEVGRQGKLTWSQLAEMAADGIDLGAFTDLHAPARLENPEDLLKALENNIIEPSRAIEHHLKRKCRDYAYPSGESDDLTIALLKKNGYRTAFTRVSGSNPFFADNFKMKRLLIDGQDDINQFQQNLTTFRMVELE